MAEAAIDQKEMDSARQLAARYQFQFVDLRDSRPDADLLRTIPLELMLHYEFLPLEADDVRLVIVVADPTNLTRLDELEARLDRKLVVKVAAPSQVRDLLEKDRAFATGSGRCHGRVSPRCDSRGGSCLGRSFA